MFVNYKGKMLDDVSMLEDANDHYQPDLHDFGCGVKLCKIENLPQTCFFRKVNKTVWHFKMVPGG